MGRQLVAAPAEKDFRALFDDSFEGYEGGKLDFKAFVERLFAYRRLHGPLLDPAHLQMQRVRRELLGALLLDSKGNAERVLPVLLEEIAVQDTLLPTLSPCKVGACSQACEVIRYVRPDADVASEL